MLARAEERRARRPPDGLLPRRDPPLQQGPAGRAAAGGRGRAGHADRRDHREPVLRGQLGAALALADLRAAGARRRGRSIELLRRALADPERGLADPPAVDDDALEMLAARAGGDARDGARRARAGGDDRRARAAASTSRPPRTRCSARRSSTTRAATSTTTTSRPGSRRPATPTSTPRSTTSRRCSRAARTRASSPAGWSSSPPRTSATPTPQALAVATAVGAAVDRVGLPECRINLAQGAVYLALAPKSNASYAALLRAEEHVREHGAAEPPAAIRERHLRRRQEARARRRLPLSPRRPGRASTTSGRCPTSVAAERFYEPTDRGFEAELAERLERIREVREAAAGIGPSPNRVVRAMGSLDSFNPATGELIGSVETVDPARGPGRRRRRRRGPAVLGRALARRTAAATCERAAELLAGDVDEVARLLTQRAGQADHRGLHDGGRADDRRASTGSPRRARRSSTTSRSGWARACSSARRRSSASSRSGSSA